jgi:hypothetical protein
MVVLPLFAEIVVVRGKGTGDVVTEKFAEVWPAATVTDAGISPTRVRLVDSETVIPPAGAGPVNVTVPREGLPPLTVVGLRLRDARTGGFTVKVASIVAPR